jgi:hypothetical protein
MPLHNVKPSTTFLIRNYFVADCVAHRSREPAKTDSMDLSPRPGTQQPLSNLFNEQSLSEDGLPLGRQRVDDPLVGVSPDGSRFRG